MVMLENYTQFNGRHYETGSLHNLLSYQGHEISEALLLGISGGITVGYFSFAYKGYDPHVAILTRNTFDPFETLMQRLGIVQDVRQTAKPAAADKHLLDVLESGRPALVWVDMFSLPYSIGPRKDDMWLMIPVVAYGHDGNSVYIADRAGVPQTLPAADFLAARGVTKKTRYKLMAVDDVNLDRLPSAIEQGLHDTVRLFNGDVPVKQAAKSIGYAGMTRWADCLTKRGDRQSWQKIFPVGPQMYAGMTSAFNSLELENGAGAERARFADCLDAAADVLGRPALKPIADAYRALAGRWTQLAEAHLPASVSAFAEARDLMRNNHTLFVEQGQAAQAEREGIVARLQEIRARMDDDFSLDEDAATELRAQWAEQVLALRDAEQEQINALQAALA